MSWPLGSRRKFATIVARVTVQKQEAISGQLLSKHVKVNPLLLNSWLPEQGVVTPWSTRQSEEFIFGQLLSSQSSVKLYLVLDAITFLKRAIEIQSLSGQEAEVAEFFVSQMKTFATKAFIDEAGNAVAEIGTGEQHIVFLGHVDTVAGDIPVKIKDGKLYGRGSVDAKGSFCTAVAAASQLSSEVLDKLRVTLIGAVEEEAPSSKGARFAITAYDKPNLVIIGEPSNWDAVTLGYKGRLIAKISVEKENFHSAGQGTTASEDVVEIWQSVQQWATELNEGIDAIFDQMQIALQAISSKSDGLTQRAEAVIGFRLPPRFSPTETEQSLHQWFEDEMSHWQFIGREQAYRSAKDTPLSRAFRIAIRQQGGKPRLKVKTGTADMNVVAPHWDVPMLAYGPGDSALDHTPEEHLELAEYEQAIAVLKAAFEILADK